MQEFSNGFKNLGLSANLTLRLQRDVTKYNPFQGNFQSEKNEWPQRFGWFDFQKPGILYKNASTA